VIFVAEFVPCRRNNGGLRAFPDTCWVFGQDDSEPLTEVPVDMAVEDPRARVIGTEAESYVPRVHSDDIAARGIDVVRNGLPSGFDDIKGMAMQVEWMSPSDGTRIRNRDLDDLVRREWIDVARR